MIKLILGDCLEKVKELATNSVDSIVTDPPYHLTSGNSKGGFMGKKWDGVDENGLGIANNVELWAECLRVLKPGGHLLAFSGTRTYHRMASAIEDAGFEVRDMIEWVYGSGFPKSLNISKAINKMTNIGLCTCVVHKDCLSLNYEKDNKQRDSISNGIDDRFSISDKIRIGGNDNNEMEKQAKSTYLSSNNAFHENSGVRKLQEKYSKKEQGLEKVCESILLQEMCESISENEGFRNASVRSGLEGNKAESKGKGQSLSNLSNKTENRITSSSFSSVQNGREKHDGEFSGALSKLPQQNRKSNGERNVESENERKIREWNIDDKFICPKCRNIKHDIGGSSLKPAHEPICMARKPLSEKSIAENCLKWGTGGINIDGSRVGTTKEDFDGLYRTPSRGGKSGEFNSCDVIQSKPSELGRFPANLIHDGSEEVVACFPETKSGKLKSDCYEKDRDNNSMFAGGENFTHKGYEADSGNASRFFKSIIYQAKASKAERNKGCDGLEEKQFGFSGGANGAINREENYEEAQGIGLNRVGSMKNNHPTVKPVALMEYLITMVTPENGTVLEPFMGSGTTGIAAVNLNRNFIGIEMDEHYFEIAENRINEAKQTLFASA